MNRFDINRKAARRNPCRDFVVYLVSMFTDCNDVL